MSLSPIGSKTDMSLQEKQSKKKKAFHFFWWDWQIFENRDILCGKLMRLKLFSNGMHVQIQSSS